MRKVIDWLSRYRKSQQRVVPRRRIDLGDRAPSFSIYAVGDVHGRLDLLKQAETRIADDIAATGKNSLTVLLGDFIDRGPSSAQVINHLMHQSEHGLRRLPLAGNHEDVFLRYLSDPKKNADWLALGGEQTLASYGIDVHGAAFLRSEREGTLVDLFAEAIPDGHKRFIASLPIMLTVGKLLFVHAGIRPGIALAEQSDEDMMWIREPFLAQGPKLPDLFVIHGHTPKDKPSPGPQRLCIDTGAFYTNTLTVLRIDGDQMQLI
ncbi:metallophosphoesterase family protein [Agrobacterium larrymoorei]|uniref:Serine/threonine protein phosphatase n=1 Tax=Agrobacterium larrymoorei TaxID=160699 RepID=A0A4D7E665_9HYPH|nr:metallophosphoesterase family protein [Agrobacterium larrymoorei]QCJ00801.1 serine/threonine protein phosphatase [Agrobacterium larrymoorei]QYA10463.1 serine/threonine protein phosphatase [Agrobacterium larrymoorei]